MKDVILDQLPTDSNRARGDAKRLQPVSVTRDGRTTTVTFHVPVPPLNWDESMDDSPTWPNAHGFELRRLAASVAIDSVNIVGNTVVITARADLPANGLCMGYADDLQCFEAVLGVKVLSSGQTSRFRSLCWGVHGGRVAQLRGGLRNAGALVSGPPTRGPDDRAPNSLVRAARPGSHH